MDIQRLKELLIYDPETGVFKNKIQRGPTALAGDITGYLNPSGYITIFIDGRHYRAHRLAWLYVYGEWPLNFIDHINHVKHDNRISNLRNATKSENMQNVVSYKHNSSGFKGVTWHKQLGKWNAKIKVNKKTISLGCYHDLADAVQARLAAEKQYHSHRVSV